MTLAEAFVCGTPVVASRLGAMAELVEDGRTGLLFELGNPDDLVSKADWAWTHWERMADMGREARREYEKSYTAESNYQTLAEIYQQAISCNRDFLPRT
jgi:glycosyltransferase involved in cell wall biosynthesis